MMIASDDIAALRAPDVLQAYCSTALGQGVRRGRAWVYPCPFGAHTRPKLEIAERDGCGVALCRACNMGGTVYHIAAAVMGLDVRKDFPAVVQGVADTVGYTLRTDDTGMLKKRHRKRKTGFSRPLDVVTPPAMKTPADKPLEYLPPDEEAAALAAVKRLADTPAAVARYAVLLGLPPDVLEYHTGTEEAAPLGLLGLDERGRLVYVYTHRPAASEPVRVVGVKTRNLPGAEPRFLMRGSKQTLWGMDAAAGARHVVITEGESDALAVRAAFWAWMEDWARNSPGDYTDDATPAVVAKPDAGTFRDEWARLMAGKTVTLISDNDAPGRTGAEKTASILQAAGVRRVFTWSPPVGIKDARFALDAAHPMLLAEHILTNRKRFHKTPEKNDKEKR